MKPPDHDPLPDPDLDALLGSRMRETTPEFEARWVAFKRQLRTEPRGRHAVPAWAAWLGLMSAGVALVAILFALHPWRSAPPPVRNLVPDVDELLTMDAALQPAAALLDAENRDALLNLPARPPPHT